MLVASGFSRTRPPRFVVSGLRLEPDQIRPASCVSGHVRTRHPARLKTFDYLGLHRYFLTFCVESRRAVFMDASTVDLVLTQFLQAAKQEGFAIILENPLRARLVARVEEYPFCGSMVFTREEIPQAVQWMPPRGSRSG